MLEARRARRYECQEAVDCEVEGQVLFGLLQDVSLGGARLRGLQLPSVGALVRVSPALGGERVWLYAQVCWVARGKVEEAGLRFLEPPARVQGGWVGELIDASDPFERRGSVRLPAAVPVEVRSIGQKPVPTWTVDLSLEGAMVRAPFNLRRHERIELKLLLPSARLHLPAVVVHPSSPERAHHSVTFSPSERDVEALTGFLSAHKPKGRVCHSDGLELLRLFNRR